MAKAIKNNTIKLKFDSAREYVPAPESKSAAKINPRYDLFINGKFEKPLSKKYFGTINPATEEKLSEVAEAGAADVNKAVAAARTAYDSVWKKMPAKERAKYIYRIARMIQERAREFAIIETLDGGKPIRESRDFDVPTAANHFFYYAGWADKLEYAFPNRTAVPMGVAGQIIPWNFPFLMAVWKVAPALAAGNTVILKPATFTPLSALKMVEIIHDTGLLPPGVLNLITGPGQVVGPELCTNPMVDKIAFTGSTEVGREIMIQASSTIKKVTLELGGKSPNIILDDADFDIAIDGSLWATFMHNGQACESGTRLLVPASIYDEFVPRLIDRASRLKVGLASDGETDLGPLISAGQLRSVEEYIKLGIEEGATPALLGQRVDDPTLAGGHFITPTIFTDVDNSMRIAQEEIFGPVLCVIKYESEEDAIRIANDTIYGLAAGVWSRDAERALSVAKRIRAGTIWINDYHLINAEAPFGGYKQSGIGRELGEWGLKEYLEVKHIHIPLNNERRSKFWYDVAVPQEF